MPSTKQEILKIEGVEKSKPVPMVKMQKWVTFNKNGIQNVYTNKPKLASGDKAFLLTLDVPQALFKDPEYQVNVSFDGTEPVTKDADATAKVKDVLSEAGIIARVKAVGPKDG